MTTDSSAFLLRPIGTVRSTLVDRADAPKQGDEGAPEAWLEIEAPFREGLEGIEPGAEILVLTWFHLSPRDVLKVRPRGDLQRGPLGVFATRSPVRPNPIGLHPVTVLEVDAERGLRVHPLEAVDGTPILDLKPVLSASR